MNHQRRAHLQTAFEESLPLPSALEPHLKDALERVLKNPGSLIRPEIVLEVALAYGLPESTAIDLAIALEYFHTASLLFDDLPAMDDAFERRGAPCIHVQYGDAGAILAALALVNRAYALIWRAVSRCPGELQPRALTYVERHLGVHGLLNGQSMDLHYASLPHDRRTVEQTAIGKTVAMVRLTFVLPALLGGASPAELQMLERIALFWGMSYQLVDDLKDVLQTSAVSGKTGSRDLQLGRPNIAVVLGVDGAARRLGRLIRLGDRPLERLLLLRPTVSFLKSLRSELGHEATQLTQSVRAEPVGVGP